MGLWQWIYLQWLFFPSLILDTVDIAHTIYPHKLAHFHQSQQWIKIQSWILNVTLMENLSQVKIHHIYSPAYYTQCLKMTQSNTCSSDKETVGYISC